LPHLFLSLVFLVQSNGVQIVEGHLVTVTAEDEHATFAVKCGSVAIAGVGFASFHESGACLFHSVVGSRGHTGGAATAHALVVYIKRLIGIFNDETVLHGDGSGRGQLRTLFFNLFSIFGGNLAAGRWAALRLGG